MNQHNAQLYELIAEIRGAFRELGALSDTMTADLGVTAAMRAVMEHLEETGPRTVPKIAKAKNVSRQHIQLLADALVERSLAEYLDNPEHKRSKLVALSVTGKDIFRQILKKEAGVLSWLAGHFDESELKRAQKTLKTLRQELSAI